MGRLRVGSVGILDALMGAEQPGPEEMQMLMRQDISVSRRWLMGAEEARRGGGSWGAFMSLGCWDRPRDRAGVGGGSGSGSGSGT